MLKSSSRISLKVGGSFIDIHSGGVDIMGSKINLNGGGSPGAPVGTMQPDVLEVLADEDHTSSGPDNSGNSGGDDNSNNNEKEKYRLRFLLKDDEQKNYSLADYIAFLPEGKKTNGENRWRWLY
ncbi:hypothetical protein JRD59_00060 [Citrobacter freundii]|nr:hypothetical protein [Citrobacter freundii]